MTRQPHHAQAAQKSTGRPGASTASLLGIPAFGRLDPTAGNLPLPYRFRPAESIELRVQAYVASGVYPTEADVEQVTRTGLHRGAAPAFTLAFIRRAGLTGHPAELLLLQGTCSKRWDLHGLWTWADELLASKIEIKGCDAQLNWNQTDGGMDQLASYDHPETEAAAWGPPNTIAPSVARVLMTHQVRTLAAPRWAVFSMSQVSADTIASTGSAGPASLTDLDRAISRYGLLGDILRAGQVRAQELLAEIPAPPLSPDATAVAIVQTARAAVRHEYARHRLRRDVQKALRASGLPHLAGAVVACDDHHRSWDCRLKVRVPSDTRTFWIGTVDPARQVDGQPVSALSAYVYGGPRLAEVQPQAPALRYDHALDVPFNDGTLPGGVWLASPKSVAWGQPGAELADLWQVTTQALAELAASVIAAIPATCSAQRTTAT